MYCLFYLEQDMLPSLLPRLIRSNMIFRRTSRTLYFSTNLAGRGKSNSEKEIPEKKEKIVKEDRTDSPFNSIGKFAKETRQNISEKNKKLEIKNSKLKNLNEKIQKENDERKKIRQGMIYISDLIVY